MTIPIQTALIVPKDYPAYADWQLASNLVHEWVERVRYWLYQQTNHLFLYNHRLHFSQYTIADLNAVENGKDTMDRSCSPYPGVEGQGMSWGIFWDQILFREMGYDRSNAGRYWNVVVGAGGWAGGWNGMERDEDLGVMVLGDWGLRAEMSHAPDPCCLKYYGSDFCLSHPAAKSFAHESAHSLDLDADNPPAIWLDDPLSLERKAKLLESNYNFLYPAASPPPRPSPPTKSSSVFLPMALGGSLLASAILLARR